MGWETCWPVRVPTCWPSKRLDALSRTAYKGVSDVNQEQRQAYEWAKNQNYQSVAARYAKILAGLVDEITPPNEALTLEQLREMNGEPAWWDDGEGSCWGIISVDTNGRWAGIPFFRGRWKQANFEYDIKSRGMTLYRRPPEGET